MPKFSPEKAQRFQKEKLKRKENEKRSQKKKIVEGFPSSPWKRSFSVRLPSADQLAHLYAFSVVAHTLRSVNETGSIHKTETKKTSDFWIHLEFGGEGKNATRFVTMVANQEIDSSMGTPRCELFLGDKRLELLSRLKVGKREEGRTYRLTFEFDIEEEEEEALEFNLFAAPKRLDHFLFGDDILLSTATSRLEFPIYHKSQIYKDAAPYFNAIRPAGVEELQKEMTFRFSHGETPLKIIPPNGGEETTLLTIKLPSLQRRLGGGRWTSHFRFEAKLDVANPFERFIHILIESEPIQNRSHNPIQIATRRQLEERYPSEDEESSSSSEESLTVTDDSD